MAALAIIAYLYSVIALVILSFKVRELIAIFKKGQPDPTRSHGAGARWSNLVKEVLGHTKMTRFTGTGIAHWFVMVGFGALLGTLITAFGQVLDPHFFIPGIGHFALIGIRQVTRFTKQGKKSRFYGSGNWKAYYVEATILAIVFCVIALRGLEGALEGVRGWSAQYPLTSFVVDVFNDQSLTSTENQIAVIAFVVRGHRSQSHHGSCLASLLGVFQYLLQALCRWS
jgi:hypothetical protein